MGNNTIEWPLEPGNVEENLRKVLTNRIWWSREGEFVKRFQDKFSAFLGIRYVYCCTNGTSAIEISLKCLDVGFLDYVIVPSITFIGTAIPVLKVGAFPVFADVDPTTSCIRLDSIQRLVQKHGSKIKAIIAVHFGGQCCDMDPIISLARDNGIAVIEDCAQAIGTMYKGRHVGSFGEIGCFSFQNSKNITSGEGGAIVTRNLGLSVKIRKFSDYNFEELGRDKEFKYLASNYRLSEFQGAVLLAQLENFSKLNSLREKNYRFLMDAISQIPGLMPMGIPEGLTKHGCHFFMFRYKKEDFRNKSKSEFMDYLQSRDIPCFGGYEHIPLDRFPYFRENLFLKNDPLWRKAYERTGFIPPEQELCECACTLANEVVWIPQFVLLRKSDCFQTMIKVINEFAG